MQLYFMYGEASPSRAMGCFNFLFWPLQFLICLSWPLETNVCILQSMMCLRSNIAQAIRFCQGAVRSRYLVRKATHGDTYDLQASLALPVTVFLTSALVV